MFRVIPFFSIIKKTSEALSTAGKGITDFFGAFDAQKIGADILDNIIPSVPEADATEATDFAFGFDLATAFKNLFDNFTFGGLFNPFPEAGAEEEFIKTPAELAEEEAFLRSLSDEERDIDETKSSSSTSGRTDRNFPDRTTSEPTTTRENTRIEGIVRSELDSQQEFKVFSSDSSQSIIGVIRQTELDPSKLLVDSFGNPLETASERASRIFEDLGQFAGEARGLPFVTPRGDIEFTFGTNTGSALKIPTGTSETESLTLAERLKIEAEKGALIFDSRSITNF